MTREDLQYFKELLLKQKREILEKAKIALAEDLKAESDMIPDEMDLASSEYEKFLTVRMRGREQMLLRKIDLSLKKIEEGTYGICDECGEEISIKRLKARPVATLCIKCKEEQERKEKMYA